MRHLNEALCVVRKLGISIMQTITSMVNTQDIVLFSKYLSEQLVLLKAAIWKKIGTQAYTAH